MTLPGYTVTLGERAATLSAAPSTSNAFFAGYLERGSVTAPIFVVSMADLVQKTGERMTGEPILYDSLEAFFREGGSKAYVGRVSVAAATATKTLVDTESKKVRLITAKSPGSWGNNIKVSVTLAESKVTYVVKYNSVTVETSPALATYEEEVAWAAENSNYIVISKEVEGSLQPKTQEVTMSGGTNTTTGATTEQVETALNLFNKDLGPGQVLAPGFTTEAVHKALLAHAVTNNRRAILDDPDESEASVIAGHATALRNVENHGARFGAYVAPWAYIPGLSGGTTRKVPFSGIFAGLIARAESEGFNPNQAAAGRKRGSCRYAIELSRSFSNANLEVLNNAGVSMAKLVKGIPTMFGNRTLTNPTTDANWIQFSATRLVMGVAAKAGTVIENFEFEEIDGHGYIFADLQGSIAGSALMPYYLDNALYGQTPAEAFQVNTGNDVNTPASIAKGEIKAQIALRVSPSGEYLTVEIVKVPTTEVL